VGWWDRLGGADDAGDRARSRIDEDRDALALAGRSPINLGLLDGQYREALESALVLDRVGAGSRDVLPAWQLQMINVHATITVEKGMPHLFVYGRLEEAEAEHLWTGGRECRAKGGLCTARGHALGCSTHEQADRR
jgi:hypothetical protein